MIPRRCDLTSVVLSGLLIAVTHCGCSSPEDGRPRGGGAGGDGGNYHNKPIHAPSKIDGTKQLPQSMVNHQTQ